MSQHNYKNVIKITNDLFFQEDIGYNVKSYVSYKKNEACSYKTDKCKGEVLKCS